MPDFPTGIPDIPNALPSETLFSMHGGLNHAVGTNRILTNLVALATKLGWGSSAPGSTPAVLKRLAAGTSIWGQVVPAELVGPGAGSAYMVLRTTDGVTIVLGKIVNADITAGAVQGGAAGATANIQALSINNGDIAATAGIVYGKLNLANGIQKTDVAAGQLPTLIQSTGYMASNSGAVTFTSIPQGFTALELRLSGRSTIGASLDSARLTINNDTSSSYWNQTLYGGGGTAGANEALAASAELGSLPGASAAANHVGAITVALHGYSRTTLFKTVHSVGYVSWDIAATTHQAQVKGSTWLGTPAAITRLDVVPAGTSWLAGSIVSLYGIP